jgi:hypothetical protein
MNLLKEESNLYSTIQLLQQKFTKSLLNFKMDFAFDKTSRISPMDEMMMGSPHIVPSKPPSVSS